MGQIVVDLSECWQEFVPKRRGSYGYSIERSANLSDEVTEARRSVRAEEEHVEREGWIVTH